MIDGDVVRDLEQPARQLELRPIALDVVEHLDEGVLREIFGELAIPNHAEDQREDRSLVAADQFAERGLAPGLREGDDVGVRQIREIERRRHASRK